MFFQAYTYSVLLVSASEKNVAATLPLLPPSDFYPVTVAGNVNEARRRLMEESFDLVIINSPLPDDAGIQFSMDVSSTTDAGVMLMVRSDIYEDTYYRVLHAGVVTLSKPTSIQMISHNLRVLCSIRERLRTVKKQQNTVEERMKEIRLENRAKLLLIQCLNMTETDAHRYIQQQAMNCHLSKREVAEIIIQTYHTEA